MFGDIVNDVNEIKIFLKKNMSEYRYDHSLMVAEEARMLANHYGLDENICYVAGLLHDVAKDFSEEKNNEYIKKYSID